MKADSYFSPLKQDRNRYNGTMDCTESTSPFDYTIRMHLDLNEATYTAC
jgi:hypothetical protein